MFFKVVRYKYPMLDLIIVGAGPAGIGLLSSIYRKQNTSTEEPLKICLIDSSVSKRFGKLADYNINSDTRAEKFLTCLNNLPPSVLSAPKLETSTKALRAFGSKAAPLPLVGEFYRALGHEICQDMISNNHLELRANIAVQSATWQGHHWSVKTKSFGREKIISARYLVLACGASEPVDRLDSFLDTYALKTNDLKSYVMSSEVLKAGPREEYLETLRTLSNPKVSIIGGSHSAISAAGKFLAQDIAFRSSGISILYRSEMRVTFNSAEDAVRHGFTDFVEDDICPHTKRVHALKGFRLDSKNLLSAVKGYGGVTLEKRINLTSITSEQAKHIRSNLQNADLVVSALGYEPDYFDLIDGATGRKIDLNAPNYVDKSSRLLNANQAVIPNCYALGLASNYNLAGRFGEPSFTGQANGLVLWYKQIGAELASTIIGN